MRIQIHPYLLCAAGVSLAACGQRESAVVPEPDQATAPMDVPKYSAQAFFETTSFGLVASTAHAFSPDGKSVLISSDATGIFNAYSLPLDRSAPKPLTDSGNDAVFAVSWFPDDERILYTQDKGGNELNHVFVREIDGSIRDLTPGDNLKAGFLGWSGDGQSLFLTSTERDQQNFDVHRYSVSDYRRELIYENPGFQISDISSDGRWLAMDKPRTSADSDIFVVYLDTEDREPVLITEHTGNIQYQTHEFTPDNKSLT